MYSCFRLHLLALVLVTFNFLSFLDLHKVLRDEEERIRYPTAPGKHLRYTTNEDDTRLSSGLNASTVTQNGNGVPYSVVLVEIRCHAALLLVLEQALTHLGPNIPIHLWHSDQNEIYIKRLIDKSDMLRVSFEKQLLKLHRFDPRDYGRIKTTMHSVYSRTYWYSRLLTSVSFWETLTTSWVITLQTDTLICSPPSPRIFDESTFIGGISGFRNGEVGLTEFQKKLEITSKHIPIPSPQVKLKPKNMTTVSHLNGGFSLRDVSWTIDCIKQFGMQSNWTEDDLFNYCQWTMNSSKLVTDLQAFSFASDNGHTMCFDFEGMQRSCPFGVHKPWKRAGHFARQNHSMYEELVANCPGLDKLEELQSQPTHCHAANETLNGRQASPTTAKPS